MRRRSEAHESITVSNLQIHSRLLAITRPQRICSDSDFFEFEVNYKLNNYLIIIQIK